MIRFAPSKINLGLHVGSLRADGYHEVDTVLYPIDWADAVEAAYAGRFSFTCYGRPCGPDASNLCLRAWQLFHEATYCDPVQLLLLKNIPAGAGLGGGSSDAVATLRLLQQLFPGLASDEQLRQWAAALGSDCPFFLENQPMQATGRGDVLTPVYINLDLTAFALVVGVPDVAVSTAWAYRELDRMRPDAGDYVTPAEVVRLPVKQWRELLFNDFEAVVFAHHPEVQVLKNSLYEAGALYAAMSGSGSAVFGIFDRLPAALPELPFPVQWWCLPPKQ